MTGIEFQPAEPAHLQTLADILNYYVLNSTATFYTEELQAEHMKEKVFFTNAIYGTFLIMQEGIVCGYCSPSPWKKQEAYKHTAETTIYLKPEFTGKRIGAAALQYLEKRASASKIYTLIAGICVENTASIKLFEQNGFLQCAHFKKVGFKFGRPLDTIYF